MRFVADVHLHSRYSRATSRNLCPETLYRWANLKGLGVLGTGDFTHPEWLAELKEKLDPAEPGLYRLRDNLSREEDNRLPSSCHGAPRFVLSTEISLIYKKDEKTRKVHHLILMPDFASVERLNRSLEAIGNLKSDGRPILGINSRDLVALTMEACDRALFIPAHIWTPHFAALGSRSGFDSLEACFEDMLPHIFAVETGLSSDPAMNWRLRMLEDYAIVSNSDAHSAPKLAREATCFNTDLSYDGIYEALNTNDPDRLLGTIEFHPEEGKYHLDGHRKCGVCLSPDQTRAAGGLCPVCGKKLTVGVLHRVELLADRAEGERPPGARAYESLIPLTEIIGSAVGVGPTSKRVAGIYERLLERLGPELHILREASVDAICEAGVPAVGEGVRRMRSGQVHIQPGYDGQYGRIEVFDSREREEWAGQKVLFEGPPGQRPVARAEQLPDQRSGTRTSITRTSVQQLDGAQREAVEAERGPVIVTAGPGTGKTRVLTHRIAHLVETGAATPDAIAAVTFTNRAAEEMADRLGQMPATEGGEVFVGTFHRMALTFHQGPDIALRDLVDEVEAQQALVDALRDSELSLPPAEARRVIGLAKASGLVPDDLANGVARAAYVAYEQRLRVLGVRDFDDVLIEFRDFLLTDDGRLLSARSRCRHLLVDEFQDVNAVQYEIVRLLAGGGEGLFVIGDPDQSIYGFRGSRPGTLRLLAREMDASLAVSLDTSYRTTPQIAMAASALMDRNCIETVRPPGPRVRFLKTEGEAAEATSVVGEMMRMIGGGDMLEAHSSAASDSTPRSFADFGVLFRTSRQMDALESALLREGIPHRIVGQKTFLDAPSVRHVLDFLRFACRPHGGRRFLRVLTLPAYAGPAGIPAAVMAQPPALPEPGLLPGPLKAAAERLVADAARYRARMEEAPADVLISERATAMGVQDDPSVQRLVRAGEAMGSVPRMLDALLFGLDADLVIAGEGLRNRPEAVTLMTLHASKGLEFPVVFICGVEEGLLPIGGFDETPLSEEDVEEERRLFYVGLTRAREEAVLLSARRRVRYGTVLRPKPSRFLNDVPESMIQVEDVASTQKARQLSLF